MIKYSFSLLAIAAIMTIFISSCKKEDEMCDETMWFEDADGDSLGNPDVSELACTQPAGYVANSNDDNDASFYVINEVDPTLFLTDGGYVAVRTVDCTLTDGTVTQCYEIVSSHTPSDHEMGPWCPEHITDGADKGGLWFDNGQVYDVDGAFIENLATFYNDPAWKLYDDEGNVIRMDTKEKCEQGARVNPPAEFTNMCAQCLPGWIEAGATYLIPVAPVKQSEPTTLSPGGTLEVPGVVYGPQVRGLAFNGVNFGIPADVDAILRAYQIAPLDDAGGHINNREGYHYHGDMGVSTRIEQADGHAAMIGYALDGHAIFAELDAQGNEALDLDECRGHYDEIRGYHYHVAGLANNEVFGCFYGAYPE